MWDSGAELMDVLRRLHNSRTIPETEDLREVLEAAIRSLEDENPVIRPRDSEGRPGGLILLKDGLTTLLVPDLHARTAYIVALMEMEIADSRVIDELLGGRLQILCVGDGFHSEARGADRWRKAWAEYEGGFLSHEAMDEEMNESLSLMAMVMILKAAFPDSFHFLKGNHENVANADGAGNRPFGKYAWEGQMVREWFQQFLGDGMLYRWAEFEASLPILAVGDRFLVSHAEPRRAYSRDQIINYRDSDQLIFDFTWTGNGESQEGAVQQMLDLYLPGESAAALYFGGHRPVTGLYGLRAEGRYVQIHNPEAYIVAILESGRSPNPDRDIRRISKESS